MSKFHKEYTFIRHKEGFKDDTRFIVVSDSNKISFIKNNGEEIECPKFPLSVVFDYIRVGHWVVVEPVSALKEIGELTSQ